MARTLFDEVIGEVPVSTVDVPRIVARQRRNRHLRTVFGAAAGVVAVLTAVTLAFGATGSPPAPPAQSPSASTHVLRFQQSLPSDSTYDWLSADLDRALHAVAPDAEWIRQPLVGAYTGHDGDPPRFSGSAQDVRTTWGVRDGDLLGTIRVEFVEPLCVSDDGHGPAYNCWSTLPCVQSCHRGTTPSGLRTVVLQYPTGAQGHVNRVMVALANGLLVSISVDNTFQTVRDTYEYAPRPPLSIEAVEQIAALVSDRIAA
ncbi:MAG: hypothetical protein HOV76_01975 [Hamadaea sp.]|nr:hypothetical protein [Hamadaea sp.]